MKIIAEISIAKILFPEYQIDDNKCDLKMSHWQDKFVCTQIWLTQSGFGFVSKNLLIIETYYELSKSCANNWIYIFFKYPDVTFKMCLFFVLNFFVCKFMRKTNKIWFLLQILFSFHPSLFYVMSPNKNV